MRSNIKRIILVSLSLIIATVFCVCFTVANRSKKRQRAAFSLQTQTDTKKAENDELCNILFLGIDSEAGLCDVMMLAGINADTDTVTVVQIPRDTYAAYTDSSYKKLNGAYHSLGGAKEAAQFVANAFGIEIHHYACINLNTFADIVDAIGGIDVELPCNMRYSDPEQGLYIDLKKGHTHLDGSQAQQFVRFRSGYADGDLGRIDAQKLFMAALFKQLADDLSAVTALKLSAALDGVETDMSVSDMLSVGADVLGMDSERIYMLTLPGEEAVATESGASYYVLSRASNEEIFIEHFGGTEFDTEEVFKNSRYESFEKIYYGYTEYSLLPVSDILRDGVELNIK